MTETIIYLLILLFSVVLHEMAHGYMALYRGDTTAKYMGRLTLNPLKHMDPIGTVLLPLFTFFASGFIFGWAKPVPYNPYNLKNPRLDEVLIALAGPATNFFLAVVAALLYRVVGNFGVELSALSFLGEQGVQTLVALLYGTTLLNVGLTLFNLIPIPPLDGSKLLFALIPEDKQHIRGAIEQYSLILFVFFILFLSSVISIPTFYITHVLLG